MARTTTVAALAERMDSFDRTLADMGHVLDSIAQTLAEPTARTSVRMRKTKRAKFAPVTCAKHGKTFPSRNGAAYHASWCDEDMS